MHQVHPYHASVQPLCGSDATCDRGTIPYRTVQYTAVAHSAQNIMWIDGYPRPSNYVPKIILVLHYVSVLDTPTVPTVVP